MSGGRVHEMGPGPRGGRLYAFHCPGCGYGHNVEVGAADGAGWTWNGSGDRPTFWPSLLVREGHHVTGQTEAECNACHEGFACRRCHSFITDGRIQFLSDSTHALAGQTVDIPEWAEAA